MKKIKDIILLNKSTNSILTHRGKSFMYISFIMLFVSYIIGTILGSNINFALSNKAATIIKYIFDDTKIDYTASFIELLLNSVSSTMIYFILSMFLGFSSIGYLFIYIIVFTNGVGYGLNQIQLFYQNSLNKNYYFLAVNSFFNIACAIIIIFCCKQSIKMSCSICQKSFMRNYKTNEYTISLNSYIIKYLIYSLILFLLNLMRIFLIKIFI